MFTSIHTFRVKPDRELIADIGQYCSDHGISSALVLSIIGSVKRVRLNYLQRLPGVYDTLEYAGPLEIVCAQGSIALKNDETIIHVHMVVSGKEICQGGHLLDAEILTTAEVSIGELDYQLQRQYDEYTSAILEIEKKIDLLMNKKN